ncbi:MAG TPA: DUF6483 family protein [Ktedonobacteraceae bacterium]|jgi:tetratricopeptide (TPR) repeat protein|nr:DUF6483 family protein [Ktedonobacteraceae bacterium]
MSQRDYILRLAEEVGRVLAQVIYRKQRQDYQGALNFIDEQYRQLLGMGAGFIHAAPEETLLALLTSFDTLDTEKCWLVATMLKAEGELYELQDNENDSYYCFLKALNLFLEVLFMLNKSSHTEKTPEVEGLIARLTPFEVPEATRKRIFRYFEQTGRYAKAEDILSELLEAHPADAVMLNEGKAFYTRLLHQSDETLRAGNFSREEAKEGLERLERMRQ